ncbi:MAG: peptidoglycan DD-metalloendopeptidase family protein [Candidatus Cohnella colombiensis]|uniref:Peptidoglycan DD-metalloendopeptidase family protein n=1 Tax=Candidatus Cohnella colombiensis TaxID=3121368 RepID=A0AA95JCT2_9BACL|nr:MAG: peptidoglycan DD-metalloendopeptidase family protein [Cohnella sp.]
MAVFRGTDRIRSAKVALRRTFRRVRSQDLKVLTYVRAIMKFFKNINSRTYRIAMVAAAAIIVVTGVVTTVVVARQNYVEAHMVPYYNVVLDGVSVGEISDKDKVAKLLSDKAAQLNKTNSKVIMVMDNQSVTYTDEKAYKKVTDDEATLTRLQGMLTTHAVGVVITVDGKKVGVVRDQQTADALLQKVKDLYVPAAAVATTSKKSGPEVRALAYTAKSADDESTSDPQSEIESISFIESVALTSEAIDASELSDLDELFATLTEGEPIPREYTVVSGDCVGCIASKLNISDELIYANNPWIKNDMIHIGDVIDLSESEPPMLNVESIEQVTQLEVIDPPVVYEKDDSIRLGQSKVRTEGKEGQQEVTYRQVKRNGGLIEEEIVKQTIIVEAVPTVILKGTKVIKGQGTGKFSWPVSSARLTSYLGKRWGRMHNGIDMIGKSTIKAADTGIVTFAGFKSGLGNCIIIDHKNGFETVYGHMKSLNAKKGQIVEKGDAIGVMGNTGHSTGTHLHFEIHLNDVVKNPLSYLK